MSHLNLKEYAIKNLNDACGRYCEDLEAMSAEQLTEKINGTGRAALDFTAETAFVNRMFASRIRREKPAEWPWNDDWPTAPEGYTKDDAVKDMKDSVAEVVAALNPVAEENMTEEFEIAEGKSTTAFGSANFLFMHMMYHCAQLNYYQAVKGDMEVHWTA